MSELVEARDFGGELFVSARNLVEALQRARESGAEHERIRLASMMTPHERKILRIREACAEGGITYERLMSRDRLPEVIRVRHRLFYEFREMGMSYPEIGRLFGRDHTTVLYGVKMEKERRNGLGNETEL